MKADSIQRRFVLEAPQERVWELLGRAIYRSLPLEQMDVVSETTFRAILQWRVAGVNLPLKVKVSLDEINPPGSLGATIQATKGVINQTVKVKFTLSKISEKKTQVVCTASGGGGGAMGWLVKGQQQNFTGGMFESLESLLKRLV
ncbi:MAG: hypothetical protein V1849_03100 [Chloroflexota bacterium]